MVITLPNDNRYSVYHGRMAENPGERVVLISPLEIDKNGKLTVNQGVTSFHEHKTVDINIGNETEVILLNAPIKPTTEY